MFDDIILIDKPANMTSFGVVARVRRVLSLKAGKKIKVGHTGTLDPFATGLMVIVTGKECKNAMKYTKLDKVYQATVRLGQKSSTGDTEGEITDISGDIPTINQIKSVLEKFVGDIKQRPPIFSAIKIAGQRAYKLAREGKTVEMPERQIRINSIEIINYNYPNLVIKADVSSGTYIRTLAEDIGDQLGVGAYCSELRRLSIADMSVDDAMTLEAFSVKD